MLNLKQIRKDTVLGQILLIKGDCPETLEVIEDCLKDHFIATATVIGMDNLRELHPDLIGQINAYAKMCLELEGSLV